VPEKVIVLKSGRTEKREVVPIRNWVAEMIATTPIALGGICSGVE
jgi:hypothetical protein